MTDAKIEQMLCEIMYGLHMFGYIKDTPQSKEFVSKKCWEDLVDTVKTNLKEDEEDNPFILTGEELQRTETKTKQY